MEPLAQEATKGVSKAAASFINENIGYGITLKKVLVILVICLLLYFVYTKFFKKSEAEQQEAQAAETIANLPINPAKLSLSTDKINFISQQLYEAMASTGTDSDTIFAMFDLIQTADDLKAVIKRFGTQRYAMFGSPSWMSWVSGTEMLNLTGWLKAELSDSELSSIRKKFQDLGVPF